MCQPINKPKADVAQCRDPAVYPAVYLRDRYLERPRRGVRSAQPDRGRADALIRDQTGERELR